MRVDPHSSLLWWVAVGKVQPFLIGLNVSDQAEPFVGDSAFVLVAEGAVHPIGRHCTRSDRVQSFVTGVALRNGCSASLRVQRFVKGAALR